MGTLRGKTISAWQAEYCTEDTKIWLGARQETTESSLSSTETEHGEKADSGASPMNCVAKNLATPQTIVNGGRASDIDMQRRKTRPKRSEHNPGSNCASGKHLQDLHNWEGGDAVNVHSDAGSCLFPHEECSVCGKPCGRTVEDVAVAGSASNKTNLQSYWGEDTGDRVVGGKSYWALAKTTEVNLTEDRPEEFASRAQRPSGTAGFLRY